MGNCNQNLNTSDDLFFFCFQFERKFLNVFRRFLILEVVQRNVATCKCIQFYDKYDRLFPRTGNGVSNLSFNYYFVNLYPK